MKKEKALKLDKLNSKELEKKQLNKIIGGFICECDSKTSKVADLRHL